MLDSGMPGCCLQQRQSACLGEAQMKFMLLTATFVLLMAVGGIAAPAQAADCLKGAAIGGVAGHYAGHHGVLGAGAGCVIGHHEATKTRSGKSPATATGPEQRESSRP